MLPTLITEKTIEYADLDVCRITPPSDLKL